MKRSGVADLPLHGGRVPPWLAERMTKVGTGIVESVLYHYGASELLSRLSDPFWFQALGCVMGMDWHSSGITTSVLGALKRGVNPRSNDLGIYICGGRGKHSRKTPEELRAVADRTSLDGNALVRASRLTARVDNNAIADGFQLYLHAFVLSKSGEWAVVQQGMRDNDGTARRYHWLGSEVSDFVNEPHAAIATDQSADSVLNMVAAESSLARTASTEFARQEPRVIDKEIARVISMALPTRHWVDIKQDINPAHLRKVMLSTYEASPQNYEQLLAIPGAGQNR